MKPKIKNISEVRSQRLIDLFAGNAFATSESQQNTANYTYKQAGGKVKPRTKKKKSK